MQTIGDDMSQTSDQKPPVLVTGGAGFIGSAVCRRLARERQVINLDKLTYAADLRGFEDLGDRHVHVHADICDRAAVAETLARYRPSGVLHLAAESHVDRSIDDASSFVQTNVVGTYSLLEAATEHWRGLTEVERETFRFLHVSTDEVYGDLSPTDPPFDEATPYRPSSPYSASKAGSDHLARAWRRTHGLPVLVTNCSNNYGPRQFPEKLIPVMTLNALAGQPLPVYGEGGNIRDWLFVDDHADALALVFDRGRPGETYMIGGDAERTNIDVVRGVCAALDGIRPAGAPHDRLISFVRDRPGHDRRYAVSHDKITKELGWRPSVDFDQGLRRTVEWYCDNQWWWAAHLSEDGLKRLGLGAGEAR